ncbi:MAG: hypothetical protein ACLGGX_05350 [Bdellovibrionia bacterium]
MFSIMERQDAMNEQTTTTPVQESPEKQKPKRHRRRRLPAW